MLAQNTNLGKVHINYLSQNFNVIPSEVETNGKRAVTCDFQQCGILTSVNSGEPVQPPSNFRNSK